VKKREKSEISKTGREVVPLVGLLAARPSPKREAWLAKLARLREQTATGQNKPSTEEILGDLRAERG
jgi:hypothetical protein